MSSATKGGAVVVALLSAVLAICLLTVGIFRPIHVPFLSSSVSEAVKRVIHSYAVVYQSVQLTWTPWQNSVQLYFAGITAAGFNRGIVARVPSAVVGIEATSLLRGDIAVQYIRLQQPVIRLFRTAGGAINLNIGETTDGFSGRVLERLLDDMSRLPSHPEGGWRSPEIFIDDGELILGDEFSGATLRMAATRVEVKPVPTGLEFLFDLVGSAGDEQFQLSATGSYKTAERIVRLTVQLSGVRPAALAELLPKLHFLVTMEFPVSGQVKLTSGTALWPESVQFDLEGSPGSLELAEISGVNLLIENVHLKGNALLQTGRLDLDELSITLPAGNVQGKGEIMTDGDVAQVNCDLLVTGVSLGEIMPFWFAQLNSGSDGASTAGDEGAVSNLSVRSKYDTVEGTLQGQGELAVWTWSGAGDDNGMHRLGSASRTFGLKISGTPGVPNVVLKSSDKVNFLK